MLKVSANAEVKKSQTSAAIAVDKSAHFLKNLLALRVLIVNDPPRNNHLMLFMRHLFARHSIVISSPWRLRFRDIKRTSACLSFEW